MIADYLDNNKISRFYLMFHEGLATEKNSPVSGFRDLAIAVIQDAFIRLKFLHRGSARRKKMAKEAFVWFLDENDPGHYSFRNLCYLLQIPPSLLLKYVHERIEGREKPYYRRQLSQHGLPRSALR